MSSPLSPPVATVLVCLDGSFVGCDYSVIYQCNMMKQALIKNLWRVGNNGDRNLYDVDLGWNLSAQKDAGSYCAEKIFRYYVEDVGLNILFYWLEDRNFYVIKTENSRHRLHQTKK